MVEDFLRAAQRVFPEGGTRVFGPMPAIMERMDGRSRMYLVLLSDNRSALHGQIDRWLPLVRQLRLSRKIRWSVDVDPQEL
jgi:primosomal protein N' (replication factor Y)